jgi:hypothetical protein
MKIFSCLPLILSEEFTATWRTQDLSPLGEESFLFQTH